MPDERRRAPRFAMRLPVAVKFANGGVHEENTFTQDVSSSGMFFFLSRQTQQGAKFECTLSLPKGELLHVPIQVRYVGEVVRVNALPDRTFGVAAVLQSHNYVINA